MRLRAPKSLLLALALVLGQWLVLAHAFEHPALQADALCQICAHAQGLDGAALSPALPLPPALVHAEVPAGDATQAPLAAPFTAYDIRGPPAFAITPAA